jgi:hypothetical protein
VLKRLADKPALLIGDLVESFDGLRRCTGIELHRAAGAMDARWASGYRLRLPAWEARCLGDRAERKG